MILAVVLAVVGAGTAAILLEKGDQASSAQAASTANTLPGPARCPDAWDETSSMRPGSGTLVPTGPAEVFLCSCRHNGPAPLRLDVSRRITDRVDNLAAYLNELPSTRPQSEICLLGETTEHAIVFGYPGQRSIKLEVRDCAWKRHGVTRFGGDLRKVTAYWGVRWNQ